MCLCRFGKIGIGGHAILALRAVFDDRHDDFWQPPRTAPTLAP